MIETFKKIWQFAGDEKKNINQSVWISFLSAILQMFQVGAIYLVIRALTEGAQGGRTAWLALLFELISIFGGAVTASFSKMHQTHAGYFMAADRRIAIADRMKSVPMGFFSANSLGQVSGVCTTVVGSIESMVPMVLVNILSGLITTAVFTLLLLPLELADRPHRPGRHRGLSPGGLRHGEKVRRHRPGQPEVPDRRSPRRCWRPSRA